MTPHHEERAIWRGDGGRPSALVLLAAVCGLLWLWVGCTVVAVWGW